MRVRKYIPDFITSMNAVCGIVGVVHAFNGCYEAAFLLMLAAAVFDFCDGLAARALDAYSDFGKELDSLCDCISFGVLPSVMLYCLSHEYTASKWVSATALLIAVFSALRLAKFNVDKRQSESFLGLPTPACAMLVGALCCYIAKDPSTFLAIWVSGPVFVPALSVILCALLVCEVPMFSLKMHKDDPQPLKNKRLAFAFIIIAAVIVCFACRLDWSVAIVLVLSCYIIKNLIYRLFGV